jgi:hypothetical protein
VSREQITASVSGDHRCVNPNALTLNASQQELSRENQL